MDNDAAYATVGSRNQRIAGASEVAGRAHALARGRAGPGLPRRAVGDRPAPARRGRRTSRRPSPRARSCAPGRCAGRSTSFPPKTCAGCSACSRRGHRGSARRYRELGLEESDFIAPRASSRERWKAARLTRAEGYEVLERGHLTRRTARHPVLGHLAQRGVLCFGPREGVSGPHPARGVGADRRATCRATRRWARWRSATSRATDRRRTRLHLVVGTLVRDARRAVEIAGSSCAEGGAAATLYSATMRRASPAPVATLLPPWDEYLVAYRDRSTLREARSLEQSLRARRQTARRRRRPRPRRVAARPGPARCGWGSTSGRHSRARAARRRTGCATLCGVPGHETRADRSLTKDMVVPGAGRREGRSECSWA